MKPGDRNRGRKVAASPVRRTFFRQWLQRIVIILLFTELLYVVTVNLSLRSGWLKNLVNRRPQKFTLSWGTAVTLIPGIIYLSDVKASGATRRIVWSASADRVMFHVELWRLINRHFASSKTVLSGFSYHWRRQNPNSTQLPSDRSRRKRKKKHNRWNVSLDNVTISDARDIKIEDYRLNGSGDITGELYYQKDRTFTFSIGELSFQKACLEQQNNTISNTLDLQGSLSMGPWKTGRDRGEKIIQTLSCDIEIKGRIATPVLLDQYISKLSWMAFDGDGTFSGRIRVEKGFVKSGSRLVYQSEAFQIDLQNYRIFGSGTIRLSVPEENTSDESQLDVSLENITVLDKTTSLDIAYGETFHIHARGVVPDLIRPPDIHTILIDPSPVWIHDLSYFNTLFPSDSKVQIGSNSGAELMLRVDIDDGTGRARLSLQASEASLKIRDIPVTGDFYLHLLVSGDDSQMRCFRLESVIIELDRLRFPTLITQHNNPWHGHLESTDMPVEFDDSMKLNGLVQFYLSDSEPFTAALRQGKKRREWFDQYIFFKDISGSAQILSDGRDVHIPRAKVSGRGIPPQIIRGSPIQIQGEILNFHTSHGKPDIRLSLDIPNTIIPDLQYLNAYLPQTAGIRFSKSGAGHIKAFVRYDKGVASMQMSLKTSDSRIQIKHMNIGGDMQLDADLRSADPKLKRFKIKHSTLKLDHVVLFNEDSSVDIKNWRGTLVLNDGTITVGKPLSADIDLSVQMKDSNPFIAALLQRKKTKPWFFSYVLFKNIEGTGNLVLAPDNLVITHATVSGNGTLPDFLEGDDYSVQVDLKNFSLNDSHYTISFDIDLEKATLNDLRTLNRFLPVKTGIRFSDSGKGILRCKASAIENRMKLNLYLDLSDTHVKFQDTSISGNLSLNIHLTSNDLYSGDFDTTDTRIQLSDIAFSGKSFSKDIEDWWADLECSGSINIHRLPNFSGSLSLIMKDSAPIVSVFAQQKKIVAWFDDLLTIPDIHGTADVFMTSEIMHFPRIIITGDRLKIRSRLLIRENIIHGLFYTKFRKLSLGIRRIGDDYFIKIIHPKDWFDRHPWPFDGEEAGEISH